MAILLTCRARFVCLFGCLLHNMLDTTPSYANGLFSSLSLAASFCAFDFDIQNAIRLLPTENFNEKNVHGCAGCVKCNVTHPILQYAAKQRKVIVRQPLLFLNSAHSSVTSAPQPLPALELPTPQQQQVLRPLPQQPSRLSLIRVWMLIHLTKTAKRRNSSPATLNLHLRLALFCAESAKWIVPMQTRTGVQIRQWTIV